MSHLARGLAACALVGLAVGRVKAADRPKPRAAEADIALAAPAPVEGTFDFQLARLTAKAGAAAPAPRPAPAVAAKPDEAGLAREVVDAAGLFESYTRTARALDGAFPDPAAVAKGVATGARYEPGQLARGAVAFGALAARCRTSPSWTRCERPPAGVAARSWRRSGWRARPPCCACPARTTPRVAWRTRSASAARR